MTVPYDDRRHRDVPVSVDRRTCEQCFRDRDFGSLEARIESIEQNCVDKRADLDRIEREIIPALTSWQERAAGIAIGLSTAGGVIGALVAYILSKGDPHQ